MANRNKMTWFLAAFISLFSLIHAQREITYTNAQNDVLILEDDRRPALYTESFGDCLGSQKSLVTVDRWDASFYKDNMTIAFHIGGTTNLTRESVMIYIAVYAYGQNRFELTWNPCGTGVTGLCPVRADTPIQANGFIPLGIEDLQSIPDIALAIPDFEGQAILRMFANSTQTEIACFTAEVTNGATFGQPAAVGSVLGIFAIVAIVASVATAIYGDSIPEMRTHYAHSMSLLVVFAVFHHIYFTGALSMNWPSVLVAFWSNYAWAAGMIYERSMQNSITKFMGRFHGNTLAVGAASAGADSTNVGGGFDVHRIYKRLDAPLLMKRKLAPGHFTSQFDKRASSSLAISKWHGDLARTGLPLPGNYSGFAGTLSKENIPAANAFLTGLIWLLICILIVVGSLVIFKYVLEALYRFNVVKTERLSIFRTRWLRFLVLIVLRICYIAFFMVTFLGIFQFTYNGSPGAIAIAAIVFVAMLVGMFTVVGLACYYRLRHGTWTSEPDRVFAERSKTARFLPWYHFHRGSKVKDSEKTFVASMPSWRIGHKSAPDAITPHEDEQFIVKYGWLASRFRNSRWWFFACWIFYEFVRACFYGGASGHALVQVYCLLIVEFIAFLAIIKLKPYEGQRLNVLMVYLLGFSKVTTVALSSAFDINFNIARIPATVIGIIIIIIQGCLTVALLICIALGAISTYFSITRNRETIKPKKWIPRRQKYLAHIKEAALDRPVPKIDSKKPVEPEVPKEPYFSVTSVKRMAKIEDEDEEFQKDILVDPRKADLPMASDEDIVSVADNPGTKKATQMRRTNSIAASLRSNASRTSLPRGAVLHRGSWSARDYRSSQADLDTMAFTGRSIPASPMTGSFPRLGNPSTPSLLVDTDEKKQPSDAIELAPTPVGSGNDHGDPKAAQDVSSISNTTLPGGQGPSAIKQDRSSIQHI